MGLSVTKALYAPVANGDNEKLNGIMAAASGFFMRVGVVYCACVVALAAIFSLTLRSSAAERYRICGGRRYRSTPGRELSLGAEVPYTYCRLRQKLFSDRTFHIVSSGRQCAESDFSLLRLRVDGSSGFVLLHAGSGDVFHSSVCPSHLSVAEAGSCSEDRGA